MSSTQHKITVKFLSSITDLSDSDWSQLKPTIYPFLNPSFLNLLESSGACTRESGWQPNHLALFSDKGIIAFIPCYLKSHSYGEYVFDFAWAEFYHQHGVHYYPKLVVGIPFTPATGPRIVSAEGHNPLTLWEVAKSALVTYTETNDISSWHLLFANEALSNSVSESYIYQRIGIQYHWKNKNYTCFEDFTATFNARKRKALNKERKSVKEQGVKFKWLTGETLCEYDMLRFYEFYKSTYIKRSGHEGYLNKNFFLSLPNVMASQVLLIAAYQNDEMIAGALNFIGNDTLYGRYWGCKHDVANLHFETCYYQTIEYCIKNNIQKLNAGAQGEHKIQRGFEPLYTYSNHFLRDERFRPAVQHAINVENNDIENYQKLVKEKLPFSKGKK